MDGPRVSYWAKSVSQRRRSSVWPPLYAESKKQWYKWTYFQNRKKLKDLEKELTVARGRDSYGVWEGHVHTATFKMDNQQGPTV